MQPFVGRLPVLHRLYHTCVRHPCLNNDFYRQFISSCGLKKMINDLPGLRYTFARVVTCPALSLGSVRSSSTHGRRTCTQFGRTVAETTLYQNQHSKTHCPGLCAQECIPCCQSTWRPKTPLLLWNRFCQAPQLRAGAVRLASWGLQCKRPTLYARVGIKLTLGQGLFKGPGYLFFPQKNLSHFWPGAQP